MILDYNLRPIKRLYSASQGIKAAFCDEAAGVKEEKS